MLFGLKTSQLDNAVGLPRLRAMDVAAHTWRQYAGLRTVSATTVEKKGHIAKVCRAKSKQAAQKQSRDSSTHKDKGPAKATHHVINVVPEDQSFRCSVCQDLEQN